MSEQSLIERAIASSGIDAITALGPSALDKLYYAWEAWARPSQLPPEINQATGRPWFVALYKCGRGYGKTRVGAEKVRSWVREFPLVNLIGATADDARDIMIEGESGILRCCPRDERPVYRKSERALRWPNGALSLVFTADEPDRLRGKQHMKVWADEIMSWRYVESWDQMVLGLRLGGCPQVIATTTPRNTPLIKSLIADPDTLMVSGSTYENKKNLAATFIRKIEEKYSGTRLGRQEIYAEVLSDVPGALWQQTRIDDLRILGRLSGVGEIVFDLPDMLRVVVAVDPSGGADADNDEQGIVGCGRGIDGHGYCLADYSCSLSPDGWGKRAVDAYVALKADLMVGEKNYGGDMVEHVIRTAAKDKGVQVNFKLITSTRGKVVRAEPIAMLAEQGRQHHVGVFPKLEDQLCSFTNTGIVAPATDGKGKKKRVSPDRADAFVFAMTELFGDELVTIDGDIATGHRRSADVADEDDEDEDDWS